MSTPPILRPVPKRPYQTQQQPASPLLSPQTQDDTPSRTHSILNLTSSTLLGIYSPTFSGEGGEASTPWGTGAQTPRTHSFASFPSVSGSLPSSPPVKRNVSHQSHHQPASKRRVALALGLRGILLFVTGMGYGLLVRHLHTDRKVANFQVEGLIKPRNDWRYLLFWGVAGVVLGAALPWVDGFFSASEEEAAAKYSRDQSGGGFQGKKEVGDDKEESIWGADWTPVVRSIGAFVGIAYAIRKLPWSSPLQASLTLALVNPVLWYLIDRSRPGFLLSTAVGFTGTALLLASNPNILPSPALGRNSTATNGHGSRDDGFDIGSSLGMRRESIEGAVWILSVLFCSCVCFGNIGRRLALRGAGARI